MTALVVKSREEWRDYWLKCFGNRNQDADVGPGSYPWLRASVFAEPMTILSGDALAIADTIPLDNMTGSQLDAKYGAKLPRNLETNASGYITISAGSAGASITIGSTLTHPSTRNTYKTTSVTATYLNGQQIAVESVDPGVGQNLAAGEVLQWTSPAPGCYATAVVFQSPDGEGLIGGTAIETDDAYRERIRDYNSNPVGHGNEGDLAALVESSREHGVPVEKCFSYPAALGTGSCAYTFTVKRDNYWESRQPSSTQITTVFSYVSSLLPGDFSITPASITTENCVLDIYVSLDPRQSQWADFSSWPAYVARGSGMIVIGFVSSPTAFHLMTDDAVYTGVTPPVPGNTIAVFDAPFGVFRRKKILTVVGAGPWVITCDATADQSDVTYTPVTLQAVSPWFDAINYCAESAGKHVAKLGPGENMLSYQLPEDGVRMSRQPRPYPDQFDSRLTARVAFDLQKEVSAIATCDFIAATPSEPSTGTVDDVSLLTLADLAIFRAP